MSSEPSDPDRNAPSSPGQSLAEPTGSAGHRRGSTYELFVLGELMGQPLHGYLLREILGRLLGPFRQVSWGSLYPLIRRLEGGGLIESVPEPAGPPRGGGPGRARQRASYRTTPAGRERFYELMLEPSPYGADYPDLFVVKLLYFGHLAPAQRVGILRHHREFLRTEEDYLRGARGRVSENPGIPEEEREHVLRMLRYRLSGVRARLGWVEEEMAPASDEDVR